jgi:hypothetical protein
MERFDPQNTPRLYDIKISDAVMLSACMLRLKMNGTD